MLAGATAAWHLGYVDRAPEGRTDIWTPGHVRVPDGIRPTVSVARIRWSPQQQRLAKPASALLRKRNLDLTRWAGGLPAFGPEAIVVQLATRPSSFAPWADLVAHLTELAADVDLDRLADLLDGQSTSAYQRAGHLLHSGRNPQGGLEILDRRPAGKLPVVEFGRTGRCPPGSGLWNPQYNLIDRTVARLQGVTGKA